MWRVVTTVAIAATLALPSAATAAAGWVPGFDEVQHDGQAWEEQAVVTPDLRTVALWSHYPTVAAAIRPRGGTFGEPFNLSAGNSNYVASDLDAIAVPGGEVLAAWQAPDGSDMVVKSIASDGSVADGYPYESGDGHPALAVNAAGTVALAYAWSNYEVRLAIRPAGSTTFGAPITLASNISAASIDVTINNDGQVAVAVGTDVVNTPGSGGGTARMLVYRRTAAGTVTTDTVESTTETFTQPTGTQSSARYRGRIELLSDGREFLAYRLTEVDQFVSSGNVVTSYVSRLKAGPRGGAAGAPVELDNGNSAITGPVAHGVVIDDAGIPAVWWRQGTSANQEALKANHGTTAGAFNPANNQTIASGGTFPSVDEAPFGMGRTGLLFVHGGVINASLSKDGAAYDAPATVATPTALANSPYADVALAGAGEGSAVATWPDGSTLQASAVHATAFDATAPTLTNVQAPNLLTAGAPGTFSATISDDWSSPSLAWSFSDGSTTSGTSVQKAFASAGSFTTTPTVTDQVGNAVSAQRTVTVDPAPVDSSSNGATSGPGSSDASQTGNTNARDTRAPTLTRVKLVPSTLRKTRRSTSLRFTLDEAATVLAQLKRARPGFRSGRRCVAERPRRGATKPCTRLIKVGVAVRGAAGAGAGQLKISRPRSRGAYRVEVTAVDAAGNRSATRLVALTVR